MPAVSQAQQRLMAIAEHNPGAVYAQEGEKGEMKKAPKKPAPKKKGY